MKNAPLILAGFMGTGKTTVSRLCAQRLDLPFIDADAEIELREGMSIPHIFERHGEAYFRQREREFAAEIAQRGGCVVATGGGMVVDDDSRTILLSSGVCVCLVATPEAILKRVGGEAAAQKRPMLTGENVTARITQLLQDRSPKYAHFHYHLDTSERTAGEVAELVADIYAAEKARTPVNIPEARARYDIVVGDGVLDQLGFMLTGKGWNAPYAIVSDTNVSSHHGQRAIQALKRAGLSGCMHIMHPGEAHKTLASVEAMYRAFSTYGLERNSPVIALGGGVVGDVAGFAAATYLRGVPFVPVPTTVLAMADSSVGGKVGVDTSFGKNLVGAFKQPDLVVMDMGTLRTLPIRELRCGMAEVVKSALLVGGAPYMRLVSWLNAAPLSNIKAAPGGLGNAHAAGSWVTGDLIDATVDAFLMKRDIVQADPFERGRRAVLNLGHTFGHGIEAWSAFQIQHGEAVSLGMVCAARLSQSLGVCSQADAQGVIELLRLVGLPTSMPDVYRFTQGLSFDGDKIWQTMQADKKKRAGKLRFVLLRAPGDVIVSEDVSETLARSALASLAKP